MYQPTSATNSPPLCQILKNSTHMVSDMVRRKKTYADIFETYCHTPLVKLNKIPQQEGIVCDMYAKCEFMNPGGSGKDRMVYRMVLDAEISGRITPGVTVLVEPTSGNTGIALALAGAIKGYRVIIVMADKDSDEKQLTMQALGAEVIRVRSDAGAIAQRIASEIPNAVVLDQFNNMSNPLGQYDTTGEELLWQLDGQIDMVVAGVGSAGYITGVGCKLKDRVPNCMIVAVDPYGSNLSYPKTVYDFEVEGIGNAGTPPGILERGTIDKWVKVHDEDSFKMARRLIREEGLLCGGSSGSAMWAAVQMAQSMQPGQRVVVIIPDTIRNYMFRFVTDQWMEARNYFPVPSSKVWWWNINVRGLIMNLLWVNVATFTSEQVTAQDALATLVDDNAPCGVVLDRNGGVAGVTTLDHIRQELTNNKDRNPTDPINRFYLVRFYKVAINTPSPPTLGYISRVLDISPFILVVRSAPNPSDSNNDIERPLGAITSESLMATVISSNLNQISRN